VADLRFAKFAGFSAWVLWAVVHVYFLIGFANRLFVLLQWGFDFLTKRRGVRVLPAELPSPRSDKSPSP
jgi:NADH dehydrogenase